ncbi:MAG: SDR family oxidoreductase [bacterium]|nr:SDR family oxidoreductase [bacterium]
MTKFQASEAIAFVTGTNKPQGIGRAIVDALLAAGARKVYATARDKAQLQELADSSGGRVVAVELDVTDPVAIQNAAAAAPDVTLLVNNSGYFGAATTLENLDGARAEMAVNYFGPMQLTAAFAPVLAQNGGGQVVNTLSIASHVNFALGSTYSASKAAAHSLTVAQRRELAGQGTTVIGVYPGPIDTAMAEEFDMDKASPATVGDATLIALQSGTEDVFPDEMAQGLYAQWRADPKAVEQAMAEPDGVSAS